MPEDLDSEELLVRYHLGELSPDERDAVEDRYFADDAFHEQVLAAEEELIDSYVRGELSIEQNKHFENWFLQADDPRERLQFARALAKYLHESEKSETQPTAENVLLGLDLEGFIHDQLAKAASETSLKGKLSERDMELLRLLLTRESVIGNLPEKDREPARRLLTSLALKSALQDIDQKAASKVKERAG